MKQRWILLIALLLGTFVAARCGGAPSSPAVTSPTAPPPATMIPPAAATPAESAAGTPAAKAPAAASACEDYFGFCVTAETRGAVTAAGNRGWGSSSKTDCAAWAAPGAARVLEFPLIVGAGKDKLTVALTRLGAYTGPGTYEMKAQVASGGIPDMFPTIEAAGRTFGNGPASTAVAVIAADGSGSVQATGLVEQASIQASNPDPNARIDFTMKWTCQGHGLGS